MPLLNFRCVLLIAIQFLRRLASHWPVHANDRLLNFGVKEAVVVCSTGAQVQSDMCKAKGADRATVRSGKRWFWVSRIGFVPFGVKIRWSRQHGNVRAAVDEVFGSLVAICNVDPVNHLRLIKRIG